MWCYKNYRTLELLFIPFFSCFFYQLEQVINEMTNGSADYCFECVGSASLMQEAYACCRQGWGKTIVLGVDQPGSQLSLNSHEVLHSGKNLIGALFGGLKAKSDIPILLKRYMDKELLLDEFVSHETRFEDINEALDKFFSFVILWFVMFPVSLNYSSDYLYLKRKLK
ncbi:hypothetical protein Pint_09278 [Pistacia integerrima]|uniref:Uncharacterized protein n=1 Tax=Pistacia integerrima TaxID=434235 RepID=A0ACC0XX89_9ROSI|nr:hypothetical protein Pint_09278 [Pistacia integerrima]